MRMFDVQYLLGDEVFSSFCTHAVDETGAQARAEAFFDANPDHDPRLKEPGLTVKVEPILFAE